VPREMHQKIACIMNAYYATVFFNFLFFYFFIFYFGKEGEKKEERTNLK
jgi:hypothetical protein